MEHAHIIQLSLVVALLSLDIYNIFMSGISRPLMTGAILGFLMNNLYLGILIGCFIELILINLIPIGPFIPPNGAVITGVTIILISYFHVYKTGTLLPVILIYTIFWGHLTRHIVKIVWKRNSVLVENFLKKVRKGKTAFWVYNLHSLAFDAVLFFLITLAGVYCGIFLFRHIIRLFIVSFYVNVILGQALVFLPLFAFTYLVNSFDAKDKVILVVSGMAVSFLIGLFIETPLAIFALTGFFGSILFYLLGRLKIIRYGI